MIENLAWSATKHDEIIKRLMNAIGQPNSQSLYGAFKQFANELCALNADAPSGFSSIDFKMLFDALRMAESQIAYLDPKKQSARTADALEQVGIALKAVAAASRSAASSDAAPVYRCGDAGCMCAPGTSCDPAPTTSPEPECKVCNDDPLVCATVPSPHCDWAPEPTGCGTPGCSDPGCTYGQDEVVPHVEVAPEPSAIFHATGFAGERLARITAPEPDAVRNSSSSELWAAHQALSSLGEWQGTNADLLWDEITRLNAALSAPVAGAWQDRWSDALSAIKSISENPARAGQHLDIRIVGPGCSVTLLEFDDFRELVARARLAGSLSRKERVTSQPDTGESYD